LISNFNLIKINVLKSYHSIFIPSYEFFPSDKISP